MIIIFRYLSLSLSLSFQRHLYLNHNSNNKNNLLYKDGISKNYTFVGRNF